VTNTPAYYGAEVITTAKGLMIYALEASIIKLFIADNVAIS
jgi:hypothetical protein